MGKKFHSDISFMILNTLIIYFSVFTAVIFLVVEREGRIYSTPSVLWFLGFP